ncbi:MAG: amidohydrolase family protein, partial [Acidobacteriota bacterium]
MMFKRVTIASIAIFSLTIFAGATTPKEKHHADRILINAKIWTGDDSRPTAEALAISGDKILAVGSNQEIRTLATSDTSNMDLKGRLVVPGFQDSHLHFPGDSIHSVKLDGLDTLEEFQKALADFAKANPDLPWITGGGWGYSVFPNQLPDKKFIDQVISDRPVYISERDGHMGVANSKALEIAGIT